MTTTLASRAMANSPTTPSLARFNAPAQGANSGALIKALPPDLLLVIFIHGYVISPAFAPNSWTEGGNSKFLLVLGAGSVVRFKGTDSTFSSFPKRLEHVLSKSVDNVVTESIIFPEYEVSLPVIFTSPDTEVDGLSSGAVD